MGSEAVGRQGSFWKEGSDQQAGTGALLRRSGKEAVPEGLGGKTHPEGTVFLSLYGLTAGLPA